jgi:hypothetical protein
LFLACLVLLFCVATSRRMLEGSPGAGAGVERFDAGSSTFSPPRWWWYRLSPAQGLLDLIHAAARGGGLT